MARTFGNTATVSAWRNTSAERVSSARFGLRLGFPLRNAWLEQNASTIELELEGGPKLTIELRAAFWNKCPEFKHAEIGEWLKAQMITLPWPLGNPLNFVMERVSGTRFALGGKLGADRSFPSKHN